MLSRVAENLYWIGRYVERAENVARLLDFAFHMELDAAAFRDQTVATPPSETVLLILGCRNAYIKAQRSAKPERDGLIRFLSFDPGELHSIRVMLKQARENAKASREVLSGDAWNQLNRLFLGVSGSRARERCDLSPLQFFDQVKRGCILFSGLVDSSLPRAEPFHFLQLGRHLERIHQIGRILQVQLSTPHDHDSQSEMNWDLVHWSNLLRSCSANESYLQEHRNQIEPLKVVEFLVMNPNFPRSIQFCVTRCCESLKAIRSSEDDPYGVEAARILGRLDSELRFLDLSEVFDAGMPDFLKRVLATSNQVGDEIHHAYFYA